MTYQCHIHALGRGCNVACLSVWLSVPTAPVAVLNVVLGTKPRQVVVSRAAANGRMQGALACVVPMGMCVFAWRLRSCCRPQLEHWTRQAAWSACRHYS